MKLDPIMNIPAPTFAVATSAALATDKLEPMMATGDFIVMVIGGIAGVMSIIWYAVKFYDRFKHGPNVKSD